jgi:hypothetical protein
MELGMIYDPLTYSRELLELTVCGVRTVGMANVKGGDRQTDI